MQRNHWIILLSLVVALAGLTGSALVMPCIDKQLTYSARLDASADPRYAWVQALGSFQGMVLDVLWMRVEKMKSEGKYHEAVQLSDLITTIQPHFAAVWVDRSHNLAYNISVGQKTPEERWMWVERGVNLLRNKGIPLNPRSIDIYKQLSWIYVHKIGQDADDHHRFYKQRVALRWSLVLGPPVSQDAEPVVESFKPIAEAFEQYVNPNPNFDLHPESRVGVIPLGTRLREALDKAVEAHPDLKRHIASKKHLALGFNHFKVRLGLAAQELSDRPKLLEAIRPLQQLVAEKERQAQIEPLDRFLEANPDAVPLVESLRAMGYKKIDNGLLLDIGRIILWDIGSDFELYDKQLKERLMNAQRIKKDLLAWMQDDSIAEPRAKFIAYLRARVLHDYYNLDPLWMLHLMAGEWLATRGGTYKTTINKQEYEVASVETEPYPIPLDWRLPATHALYWASLGVRRSAGVLRPQDSDVLNTDRNVIHALKQLYERGSLLYDPISGDYSAMKNLRYAEAYGRAVFGAFGRITSFEQEGFLAKTTAPSTFLDGHENFFLEATVEAYFANDLVRGNRYLQMLRQKYGHQNGREHYFKPLGEFAQETFLKAEFLRSRQRMAEAVGGLIVRALHQGLVESDPKQFEHFLKIAKYLYLKYHEDILFDQTQKDVERRGLEGFRKLVARTFIQSFMASSTRSPLIKARAWANAPLWLRHWCYEVVINMRVLQVQCKNYGLDLNTVIPKPSGYEAFVQEQKRRQLEDKKKNEERNSGQKPGSSTPPR